MPTDRQKFALLSLALGVLLLLALAEPFVADYTLRPSLINALSSIIIALIVGDKASQHFDESGKNGGE